MPDMTLADAVQGLCASMASHPQVDPCAILSSLVVVYNEPLNPSVDAGIQAVTTALRRVLESLRDGDASLNREVLQASPLPPRVVACLVDSAKQIVHTKSAIPHLNRLDWRVDLIVASNLLKTIRQPSIVLRLQLTDGHIHTIELSVDKFHELRYNTAKMLQEMNQLERHPIMRLTLDGHTSV
ncbi:hypothetical protein AeMF1_000754 [Aphanomyces euteiches]|nr:hypothetical protein AeMF1_000754 [Aphanomyces euteiches]KAH9185542.1 hypothetical protein AeNC1_012482 [Aphanomyces euteiches]